MSPHHYLRSNKIFQFPFTPYSILLNYCLVKFNIYNRNSVISFFKIIFLFILETDQPQWFKTDQYKLLIHQFSILPGLYKLVEAILAERTKTHSNQNTHLLSVQSGFRLNYNCTTTLLDVTNYIFQSTDQNELLSYFCWILAKRLTP